MAELPLKRSSLLLEEGQPMKNPTLDRLHAASYPALAKAIRARKEAVLTRWQSAIVQCLPDADALTLDAVRDGLPEALEDLAESLDDSSDAPLRELLRESQTHGLCRFHQSFNLNELLIEYGVLRGILIEETLPELGRSVQPAEMAALDAALDELMRRGVIAFVTHQKRQIQSAADMESKYLAFLSHDMRGSLNGILLMVEVLHRELGGQKQFADSISDLEIMRQSIMDTVGTMDRFLQVERLRKGKVPLKLAKVDLKRFIRDLTAQFAIQATKKGLSLVSEFSGACEVHTDRNMVLLILQNLIANAIKYADKGTICLRLNSDPARCVISVIDEGPGIAPDRLGKLFEAFERGETFGEPGVGLGLAIARQAAEQIGATIRVDSTPGKGTAFHVEIPKIREDVSVEAAA
jgi:signal transduction histidine kinase